MTETIIKWRIEQLKAMDTLIRSVNNENLVLDSWLMCGIPDGATDTDYRDYAENVDDYKELCDFFLKLMARCVLAVADNGISEFALAH